MATESEQDDNSMDVSKPIDEVSAAADNLTESENSSSDEDDEEQEKISSDLQKKVEANPYDYNSHIALIGQLRKQGELDRARTARENMHKAFPLSAELWLDWIQDETKVATSEKEKEYVISLFEKATQDYLSVELWLEYAQFSIGNMVNLDTGVENVRSVFERALTAGGLHVTKGAILWEAYREFENVILSHKIPKDEVLEIPDEFTVQKKRLANLFRRQLSCPLFDADKTYEEYVEWSKSLNEDLDKNTETGYHKAVKKLEQIISYEKKLLQCDEAEKANTFKEYLGFERKSGGDPARIQCLYERAVSEVCLDFTLWKDYVEYLYWDLKVESLIFPVCERAVRNCPWNSELWQLYLRALEKYDKSDDKIKGIVERALSVGFSSSEDYRNLWLSYIDYLVRKTQQLHLPLKNDHKNSEEVKEFSEVRAAFNRACEQLAQYFGLEGDPTCMLLQYWARVEAGLIKDMEKARLLWNDILSQGHNKTYSMWIEYINLERCYGDTKHLRKLFQRAISSVNDWPEVIGNAWLNFERLEGSLENFDICEQKVKERLKQVQDQRDKEATKEIVQAQKKKKLQCDPDLRKHHETNKRKHGEDGHSSAGKWASFAAETILVKSNTGNEKDAIPQNAVENEPPQKKQKKIEEPSGEHGTFVEHNPAKDDRTVFVSNLDYSISEASIKEKFSDVGIITDLRLVKDFKGRSKGFCYIEFQSSGEATEALKKDRELVENRPMFVSKCDPDRQTRQTVFKYNTNLEKNKLFIKGLPPTTTKQDLEELFKEYGKLKDVRIVTYRNGHSKGIAYVEYENETDAAHALVKTDGMAIDNKVISVAISKPPERRPTGNPILPPVLSLGGGPKDLGLRGRGRTMVSLVPRSVQISKYGDGTANAPGPSKTVSEGSVHPEKKKTMSNAAFREMFLNSKN